MLSYSIAGLKQPLERRLDGSWKDTMQGHAVQEQALQSLLDVEFGVEDDQPEADGEGVIA
jgi:hypothetical protein